jgi:hypothetical protein
MDLMEVQCKYMYWIQIIRIMFFSLWVLMPCELVVRFEHFRETYSRLLQCNSALNIKTV